MNRISSCCRFVVHQLVRMSSTNGSYEEAIRKLNKLQSNKSTIEQIRRDRNNGKVCTNIDDMVNYLSRTEVSLSMLDSLSVIHIAGTKGKGSTSAMCESILRHHGCRTGFYSSPHLVEVRERIRLDGRIVDKEHFSKHFHRVYDMLYKTQAYEGDMPKYFAFMTVLAFNVFLIEKVDVAIVEVGIGGVVDYTNVLRKAPVLGITALGIDHTAILGNTLPQIAAAKAGIMKPGCLAFTVNQPPEAMDVLRKVAVDVKCSLNIVPDYKMYKFPNDHKNETPYNLEVYQMNASLAIQLAHAWLFKTKALRSNTVIINKYINGRINGQNGYSKCDQYDYDSEKINGHVFKTIKSIPEETVTGLRACRWPGRYQVIKTDYAQVYLDGAHTKESIEICAKWFQQYSRCQDKILIFCTTGNRDGESLLWPLKGIHFKTVFFVVPTAYQQLNDKNDNYSLTDQSESLSVCNQNVEIWKQLCEYRSQVIVKQCVSTALLEIEKNCGEKSTSVLITGSLHLVGAAISILDPSFP